MLTGENGLLTQAQKAKEETEYANAKEEVEMAVLKCIDYTTGRLKPAREAKEILKEFVESNGDVTGDDYPLTVKYKGYTFKVASNKVVTGERGTNNGGGSGTNTGSYTAGIWNDDPPVYNSNEGVAGVRTYERANPNPKLTDDPKYTWEKLSEIAQIISANDTIDGTNSNIEGKINAKDINEITVIINNETYVLAVGDIVSVTYDANSNGQVDSGETKTARIVGFKSDELVPAETTKEDGYKGLKYAGITFQFISYIENNQRMNSSNKNTDGWAKTGLRKNINGYSTTDDEQENTIGGYALKLENKNYIKQVKKEYGTEYNSSNTSFSYDFLWLFSCGEIWNAPWNSYTEGFTVGMTLSREGTQYAFFRKHVGNQFANKANSYIANGNSNYSWLRSCYAGNDRSFCILENDDRPNN